MPLLFVRELQPEEGTHLQRLIKRSKDPVEIRRATVVLASAQGEKVRDIARLTAFTDEYVRDIINDFNERGFAALPGGKPRGAGPKFSKEDQERIVGVALGRPRDYGFPLSRWSLRKLQQALVWNGIVDYINHETLRQILHEHGVRFQATKTWEESHDPEYEPKKTTSGSYKKNRHPTRKS
jgi:transposase